MSPKVSHGNSPLIPPSFLLNDLKEEAPEKCVGTPDYLAPECVLGMSQDAMVDWVRENSTIIDLYHAFRDGGLFFPNEDLHFSTFSSAW